MIFFNWKKIVKHSGRSSKRIVQIIKFLSFGEQLTSRRDPMYKLAHINFYGDSFLLKPTLFIDNSQYSYKKRAEYTALAALRSYANYKITGETTLDLAHSPVGQDIINQNELLHIDNNKIHFLYEDYNKEKQLCH